MKNTPRLFREVLDIDPGEELLQLCSRLRSVLKNDLKRRGMVVGLSGGIDSSVTAAIAVKALGKERVLGLLMPERHSGEETLGVSSLVAESLGIPYLLEDITKVLEAVGFYHKYDEAVRLTIPEYGATWKSKIVLPNVFESKGIHVYSIVAQRPDKTIVQKRLSLESYLGIVAATNFKQRTRKMLEYYHADRLNYAVAGTPNRLEYDQGFFVKNGDGSADVKPIAHLYKTQVYRLAEYLGIPQAVISRPPSTDTYSLGQGQDEFFFSLPFDKMDLCLYGKNNGIPAEKVADGIGLTPHQIEIVYDDIDRKRAATRYLHMPPVLLKNVPEVDLL